MAIVNQCPVCQARFRGSRICSRCGADLEPLMVISVNAWRLREAARQALLDGEIGRAFALAAEAESLQATAPARAPAPESGMLQPANCPTRGSDSAACAGGRPPPEFGAGSLGPPFPTAN